MRIIDKYLFCHDNNTMNGKAGRPRKEKKLGETLEIRLDRAEKQAFKDAADLAGVPVSAWVRERLRWAATRELVDGGRPVAFLDPEVLANG